jgi:hypothetical protein
MHALLPPPMPSTLAMEQATTGVTSGIRVMAMTIEQIERFRR